MSENTTTKTDAKAPKAKDFKAYAKKTPTNLHVHYTNWLADKTGIELPEQAAKVVQLAVSLYHDYQASDENKARREAEAKARPEKAPGKLAMAQAEIERLQAELAAARGTPSTTATGEASTKPVGRRAIAAKK